MPLSLSELLNPAPNSMETLSYEDEAQSQSTQHVGFTHSSSNPLTLRQTLLDAQDLPPSPEATLTAGSQVIGERYLVRPFPGLMSATLSHGPNGTLPPNTSIDNSSDPRSSNSIANMSSAEIQPEVETAPIRDSMEFGSEHALVQIAEQATNNVGRGSSLVADGSQDGTQLQVNDQLRLSTEAAANPKPKPKKSTTKDEGMHSDKRYLCYLCNKLFTRRRSVRDHISKIHNIKTWDPTRSLEIIVDPATGECVEPLEEQIKKAGQIPAAVTPPPPLPAPLLKVVLVKTEPSLTGSRASSVDRSVAPATAIPTISAPVSSKKRPAPAMKEKKSMARMKSASTPNKKIKLGESENMTGAMPTRSPSATPASARTKTPLSKLVSQSSRSLASSPSPSRSRSESAMLSDDLNEASTPGTNDDGEVFCICRKGDNHTWMIACDGGCDEWYHGNCVNIRERDGDLIDKYICPTCTKPELTTTWKRMCRRKACRKPARVLDVPPSKYCSPECGRKFFVEMVQRSDPHARASNNGQYITDPPPAKKLRKRWRRKPLPREDLVKEAHEHIDGTPARGDTPMLDQLHLDDDQSEYEVDSSADDHELPNRGSTLRAGEVKMIADRRKTIDEWRELGSKPINPPVEGNAEAKLDDSEKDTKAVLAKLMSVCRERISLLEAREQLLEMIKTRSVGIAEDVRKTDKKNKDPCGFDPRLSWTEEEFLLWRNSDDGKSASANNRIGPPKEVEDGNASDSEDSEDVLPTKGGVCIKSRCQRHRTWQKAQLAEIRFEQDLIRRKMERLEKEEADVLGRAVLRAWEKWEI